MTEMKNQYSEHDRIFYSDGYKLAQTAIEEGLTNETLLAAIKLLYTEIDLLIESILAMAEKQNIQVACSKGCEWCCHQAVYANSYELHFLSEYISLNFEKIAIDELAGKSASKDKITSVLSEPEIQKYKSPCPLLSQGACTAYAARPLACRIYLSTKLESCLEFFKHPENDENYPALLDFPLRAGRMMNEGFGAALKSAGVETAEFRLEEGLTIIFKEQS